MLITSQEDKLIALVATDMPSSLKECLQSVLETSLDTSLKDVQPGGRKPTTKAFHFNCFSRFSLSVSLSFVYIVIY